MFFKQSLKQSQTKLDKEEKNCLGKEVEMLLMYYGNSPTGHCACLCTYRRSQPLPASLWIVPSGPVCASLLSNQCYWIDCPVNKSKLLSIHISHPVSFQSKSLHRQLQVNKSSQEKEAAAEKVLQI